MSHHELSRALVRHSHVIAFPAFNLGVVHLSGVDTTHICYSSAEIEQRRLAFSFCKITKQAIVRVNLNHNEAGCSVNALICCTLCLNKKTLVSRSNMNSINI